MKKLFFLLVLVACTFSAQAQIIDSLPWFKLERVAFQLGDRIGTISGDQLKSMRTAVSPILQRSRGKVVTKPLRIKLRQEVRKAIEGVLTPEQKGRLKATRKGEQDALDQAMVGKSRATRKRQ
jgi:Spy/CpxP family protein refolding chaperone